MSFRVVHLYDDTEGWSRWSVVKTLEQDPSAWGVVGYYPNPWDARRALVAMSEERVRLEQSTRELEGEGAA